MALLELHNVCVPVPSGNRINRSDERLVLVDNVSCKLDSGEILAVIGPNGAGKSTLLQAISGDLTYTGEININGVSEEPKLRARQIAVLPQLSLLNFPYRVSEVVGLSRIPHQTGIERDRQIIDQALATMDIDFLKDRLYTELSGGEKQRVQLARVFAQIWSADDAPEGTRLLLLDEPTFALDLGHQQQLMQIITSFAKQGVAVMMVLHDINLAAYYADRLLALLCSQQIALGEPNEVISEDIINRLFGIKTSIIKHPDHDAPVVLGI